MRILCCVKQVPDLDLMRMDPETGSLIRSGVPAIMNPMDYYAISAAVKLKQQYGGTVTLITMGPPLAEEVLREALALGCDDAILLTDRAFGNADTLATSYSILMGAKMKGEYDVIVCGKESLDGATGQMASQLAQRFGASMLSACIEVLEMDELGRSITVKRNTDSGIETVKAKLPCLLTVEKEYFPESRATLKSKLFALDAPVSVITAADIPELDMSRVGDKGSPTKVPRMFPPSVPQAGEIFGSTSAFIEKVRTFM